MLDHDDARRRARRGGVRAAARAPRPRVARCRSTVRRAAGAVGRSAMTHARSTMRRVPVDSSCTNLSRNASSPSIPTSLVDPCRRPSCSESATTGRFSAAATGSRTSTACVERDRDRLLHRERREEPAVLERAAEAEVGLASAVGSRVRSRALSPSPRSPRARPCRSRRSRSRTGRRRASSCPAPFGPRTPRISPGASENETSSSAVIPPKRFVEGARPRGPGRRGRRRRRVRRLMRIPERVPAIAAPCAPAPPSGSRRRRALGDRALEEDGAHEVGSVEELRGGSVEPDLALLQEVRGVGELERDADRLLDDDDRRARPRRARGSSASSCRDDDRARGRATARRSAAVGAGSANAMASVSICCWPPERSPARSVGADPGAPGTRSRAPSPTAWRTAAGSRGGGSTPRAGGSRRP